MNQERQNIFHPVVHRPMKYLFLDFTDNKDRTFIVNFWTDFWSLSLTIWTKWTGGITINYQCRQYQHLVPVYETKLIILAPCDARKIPPGVMFPVLKEWRHRYFCPEEME